MAADAAVQTGEKRNASLDVIRTIAIILVVLTHSVEAAFPLHRISVMSSLGTGTLSFCYIAFTLGRIGVPLFFLLSGYLLLPRDFFQKKNGVLLFYKKNLLPLLLTWEIWVLLYNLLLAWMSGAAFSLQSYLLEAAFLKEVPTGHAWYVPRILAIYLLVPFLSKLLSRMKGRGIGILMGICWVLFFVFPQLRYKGLQFGSAVEVLLNLCACTFYVLCGYCIFRFEGKGNLPENRRKYRIVIAAGAALAFLVTAFSHFMMLNKGQEYYVWYDFFLLPPIGIAVFVLLKQIRPAASWKPLLLELSVCSFGIYLVHKPLLDLLARILPKFHPVPKTFVFLLLVFPVSFLLVTLIGRIGGGRVGKVLFLRKKPSGMKPKKEASI